MARITSAPATFIRRVKSRTIDHKPLRGYEESTAQWTQTFVKVASSSNRSDIFKVPISSDGWRAPAPYTANFDEHKPFTGSCQRSYRLGAGLYPGEGSDLTWNGYIKDVAPIRLAEPPSGNEVASVEAQLLSQLKDQRVNYAMALAQRKQTVGFIADTAKTILQSYQLARRGNFYGALRTLGATGYWKGDSASVARKWLQFHFAVKPLMSDIHGAVTGLLDVNPKSGDIVVVRATRSASEAVAEDIDYPWDVTSSGNTYLKIRRSGFAKRDIRVVAWYELNLEELRSLSRNGWTNPAHVLWDAVPYSFVVDWLLPVGRYLSNLDAAAAYRFKGGSRTFFYQSAVTEVGVGGWTTYQAKRKYKTWALGSGSGSRRVTKMERVVYSASPAPTFYFKNPFSVWTVSTAAALLRNISRR